MKLSAAIIAHNEEKNIIRALQSIYEWVDEIVFIDAQSRDDTVKRVRAYDGQKKIKIFHEDNPPNFILNKQKAIERCTGEWILELDADEVVSEELQKEIQSIINKQTNSTNSDQLQPVAFRISRLNFFLGKPLRKGGQYPNHVMRLYRNRHARFPGKTIHDQVEIINPKLEIPSSKQKSFGASPACRLPAVGRAGRDLECGASSVGYLQSPLLHFPYPDFETYLRKWVQYAAFEAAALAEQGIKPSLWRSVQYFFILPGKWFFTVYARHKGFQDGFAGFAFALFSAIRYWIIYVKLVEQTTDRSNSGVGHAYE